MNWSDYFSFDHGSGRLFWRVNRPGPKANIGDEVGSIKSDGRYRSFVLFHKRFYTHRVIWEMHNGPIPVDMCIDHIDGDGLNNRLDNLRLATLSKNQRNRRLNRNSTTGVAGVIRHSGGFTVQCAGDYIGYTKDFSEACEMRRDAERARGYINGDRHEIA